MSTENMTIRVRTVKTRSYEKTGMVFFDIGFFGEEGILFKTRLTVGNYVSMSHTPLVAERFADRIMEAAKTMEPIPDPGAKEDEWFIPLGRDSGTVRYSNNFRPLTSTSPGNGTGNGKGSKSSTGQEGIKLLVGLLKLAGIQ